MTTVAALRLVLAYRHGHDRLVPMTRQAEEEAAGAEVWRAWLDARPTPAGAAVVAPPLVLVHVWAGPRVLRRVVEVVTYFAQHDVDVDAYFADELPAGWPDWLSIVGLA